MQAGTAVFVLPFLPPYSRATVQTIPPGCSFSTPGRPAVDMKQRTASMFDSVTTNGFPPRCLNPQVMHSKRALGIGRLGTNESAPATSSASMRRNSSRAGPRELVRNLDGPGGPTRHPVLGRSVLVTIWSPGSS
eukprot:7381790-Prymnesium_polylepis.1